MMQRQIKNTIIHSVTMRMTSMTQTMKHGTSSQTEDEVDSDEISISNAMKENKTIVRKKKINPRRVETSQVTHPVSKCEDNFTFDGAEDLEQKDGDSDTKGNNN